MNSIKLTDEELKDKIQEWSSEFTLWLTKPKPELVDIFTFLDFLNAKDPSQDKVENPYSFEMIKTSQDKSLLEKILVGRFYWLGIKTTWSVIMRVSCLVESPGDVAMICAYIASRCKEEKVSDKLLTWKWLSENVFNKGVPDSSCYSNMWNRQKHDNVNLLDIPGLFK